MQLTVPPGSTDDSVRPASKGTPAGMMVASASASEMKPRSSPLASASPGSPTKVADSATLRRVTGVPARSSVNVPVGEAKQGSVGSATAGT